MEVTREELNPCTIKLTVVCDAEQVKVGFDKALKQIAKKIKLPGFRPGHAPKSMIEGLISRDELYETATDIIVRDSFKKALDQEEVHPDTTVRPTVELIKLDRDKPEAEYSAKVPLPPQVELGDYKGLPLEKTRIDVTDEELDQQIEDFRKRKQTRETVTDRGVETGDAAVVNIKAEGEEGEGRNFMTIAGQMFPALNEAMEGMKVEEMKNLELSFPENFQEKDWAGKTLKVQLTLNSLSGVKLPDVDDAFAQSLQTENVQDLRNRIREALASAKQQMVRDMSTEQLLEKLHERSTVHVSDNMWEALAAQRMQETAQEQQKAGKSMEQYAAENGMTVEALYDAWKSKAKMHIERALLIREVFTKEGMQLSNEELNRELYAMAGEYGVEAEQMFNMLRENNALDELQFRTISRKVSDFLEANAEITEVDPAAQAEPEAEPVAEAKPAKASKKKAEA
ncbi:trigger factor [Fimbriimonas ginsengisoli]|uniref:Trigger factor n=1 Tax=Fimbriimonas ginsengisoli Gsoil 348 TaxID=661478 RepID=A0A068NY20_FIMGI|nr:trigger factor [Fimbriimonas ginsengisoli]AIE86564.1 Cell division trigger factor [Fimbriimonas ginsengisoli Gsoil 348]